MLKKAGLPQSNTMHGFRHSYATELSDSGAGPKTTRTILGWKRKSGMLARREVDGSHLGHTCVPPRRPRVWVIVTCQRWPGRLATRADQPGSGKS
jgi:integrase